MEWENGKSKTFEPNSVKDRILQLKTGHLKKRQKHIKDLWLKKSDFFFHSFTCIFSDYIANDITKEFWKISDFENMTAGFS